MARVKPTTLGSKAIASTATMKYLKARRAHPSLRILAESPAQYETNENSDPTNQDVRNIRKEPCAQIERCDAVDKNPSIEITLPEEKSHHPVQSVNNAE
jgi:hypothetical protein